MWTLADLASCPGICTKRKNCFCLWEIVHETLLGRVVGVLQATWQIDLFSVLLTHCYHFNIMITKNKRLLIKSHSRCDIRFISDLNLFLYVLLMLGDPLSVTIVSIQWRKNSRSSQKNKGDSNKRRLESQVFFSFLFSRDSWECHEFLVLISFLLAILSMSLCMTRGAKGHKVGLLLQALVQKRQWSESRP